MSISLQFIQQIKFKCYYKKALSTFQRCFGIRNNKDEQKELSC